ncbi:MAG: hypothetical protein CSA53_04115 [Gammaproteobacteria bacterium]|nr:MAG: hypothetical protein CSA53_04115 [Gammaproteobacteria bacterium]
MEIKKTSSRFKRLRQRYFSTKAAVLFILNRKIKGAVGLGEDFGRITDIELDRGKKDITMEVTQEDAVNTIAVRGYGFEQRKGKPYLIWKTMDFAGPAGEEYRRRFAGMNGIELSKKYIAVVEAVL